MMPNSHKFQGSECLAGLETTRERSRNSIIPLKSIQTRACIIETESFLYGRLSNNGPFLRSPVQVTQPTFGEGGGGHVLQEKRPDNDLTFEIYMSPNLASRTTSFTQNSKSIHP